MIFMDGDQGSLNDAFPLTQFSVCLRARTFHFGAEKDLFELSRLLLLLLPLFGVLI